MAFVWHFTQANAICYYIGFQLVKRLYGIMKIFFNLKIDNWILSLSHKSNNSLHNLNIRIIWLARRPETRKRLYL